MEYKVGDIFTVDDEYSKRAQFCNENNLMIVEITKEADSERWFAIREVPPPNKRDLLCQEIYKLKVELEKAKEDIEQVELFGMTRTDYDTKKTRCAEIVLKLRELEKEVKQYE